MQQLIHPPPPPHTHTLTIHTLTSGKNAPKERESLWGSRRVFFLTPQVMQNDLTTGICPAHKVCCVVFDEAHRALGNFAYCQVSERVDRDGSSPQSHEVCCQLISLCRNPPVHSSCKTLSFCVSCLQVVKELAKEEVRFRVLALSATPGSDMKVRLTTSHPIPNAFDLACFGRPCKRGAWC